MKESTRIARKMVAADQDDRERKCRGKVQHHSRKEAKGAMRQLIEKHRYDKADFRVYRCPYCGQFHFGHVPAHKR